MTTSNTTRSVFRWITLAALGAGAIAKAKKPFQTHRHSKTMAFVLALVLAYAGAFASADAASDSGPVLTTAVITIGASGTVNVAGIGFTPGGLVYIAIYDQWGAPIYESRWVSASDIVYGLNGSIDPSAGFVRAGTISERFAHQCGTATMVRAYDQQTAAWSNWIEADSTATGISNYFGATGSLDPAFGYRPSC